MEIELDMPSRVKFYNNGKRLTKEQVEMFVKSAKRREKAVLTEEQCRQVLWGDKGRRV